VAVLEEFFGTKAGLSPATITRLSEQWQEEERMRFMRRDLSRRDYVGMCGWMGFTPASGSVEMSGCVAW
jgi:hypothetical protein